MRQSLKASHQFGGEPW